jgi:hypothetical protein
MSPAWIRTDEQLPPEGVPVHTKIDDSRGCRNEQTLKRKGGVWFFTDMSMYVYYTPTHWKHTDLYQAAMESNR